MMQEADPREELQRLNALRFCGVWKTDHGDFALFEDALGTRSSFMLKTGETLGDGVQRITDRYEKYEAGARGAMNHPTKATNIP